MRIFSEKNIKVLFLAFSALIFLSLFFTEAILMRAINIAPDSRIGYQDKRDHIGRNAYAPKNIQRLSEVRGPQIDNEAAAISCLEKQEFPEINNCNTLPKNIWVFLLAIYAALLIYNLSYGFEWQKKIRWVWETILTIIFLFGWNFFDLCSQDIWFPLYLVKLGLIIYFLYLYFFTKRHIDNIESES